MSVESPSKPPETPSKPAVSSSKPVETPPKPAESSSPPPEKPKAPKPEGDAPAPGGAESAIDRPKATTGTERPAVPNPDAPPQTGSTGGETTAGEPKGDSRTGKSAARQPNETPNKGSRGDSTDAAPHATGSTNNDAAPRSGGASSDAAGGRVRAAQPPSEQAAQQTPERTVQPPVEQKTQRPADLKTQPPAEQTPQRLPEQTAQLPTDRTVQRPADQAAQRPSEQTAQRPAEQAAQRSPEQTAQRPAEQPTQRPADQAGQQPIDQKPHPSADQRTQRPADQTTGPLADQTEAKKILGTDDGNTGEQSGDAIPEGKHVEPPDDIRRPLFPYEVLKAQPNYKDQYKKALEDRDRDPEEHDRLRLSQSKDLEPDQMREVADVRNDIPVGPGTILTKVLRDDMASKYLDNDTSGDFDPATMQGFIARGGDTADARTPDALREALALDDKGERWSPVPEGADHAYQLRFRRPRDTVLEPAFGARPKDPAAFDMASAGKRDKPVFQGDPFLGTGYVDKSGLPEWESPGMKFDGRAEIWKMNADGSEQLVGAYSPGLGRWVRV